MKIEINYNFTGICWIIFIILKLCNIITWNWWCVNIPLFIMIMVTICTFIYAKYKHNPYCKYFGITEKLTVNI